MLKPSHTATYMEWLDYLAEVANGKRDVDWLSTKIKLSPKVSEALLAVLNSPYKPRHFGEVTQEIYRAESTIKSQLQSIYVKWTVEPATVEELHALLKRGFDRLQREATSADSSDNPPIPTPILSIQPPTPQIDWLDRSRQLLQSQKHLTTNRLLNKSNRNLDDIHVPLGLIERKERPKVKEEPSPEQGSQIYHPVEYIDTRRFEHEAFLAEVMGKPTGGKHIAIIGEPGAGKTTILTKIGTWLIGQAEQQPPAPLVVTWISLADVGSRRLQKYLRDEWLEKVCEDNFEAAWEDWKGLRQQGRVWLLLDGLDEMSGDALAAIHRDLGLAWAHNLRVVMTCRINQWETASNNLVNSFDVYRTLDYSYRTSQGEDQVKEFISKWFTDSEKVATQIRTELDAPGKERIKDLVKNPLRLTLLCASWEKDNQALPETQADLYRGFVTYLYKWKAAEFSDEVKLRQELDLALGELAKAGLNRQPINDGAVRRFRFTASEISKLWKDRSDTLLPAADKLGWLNVVGEESGEAVYAFYHPTFQEYFAACSIDDWDYFLPRGHVDRPVLCKTGENLYRVFEQEWRQVILLWMGRRDNVVTDELKEKFIDKLTDFREQERQFYYYRAYCMAAICVGEFRFSRRAKAIVQQIAEWAFVDLDPENQQWIIYRSLAREMIPFTHRKYAISILLDLFRNLKAGRVDRLMLVKTLGKIGTGYAKNIQDTIDLFGCSYHNDYTDELDWCRLEITEALEQIESGCMGGILNLITLVPDAAEAFGLGQIVANERAISTLIDELRLEHSFEFSSSLVKTLGQLAVGNERAISTLIDLLCDPKVNYGLRCDVAKSLGQISVGDEKTILALIDLLRDPKVTNLLRYHVAKSLGQISVEHEKAATAALIDFLRKPNLTRFLRFDDVANTLASSLTKTTMPLAIWLLKNNVTDEVYNSIYEQYESCYKVLFHCAQTLPYPEFHAAWHQTHLPTTPFSPQTLHQKLNRPNTIILDITTLNHHTTPELAQELSNRIHHHLNTQPIPQIQNIPQLKPELLNLKPHLALILYHPTPTPTLIQEIAKLHTPKQIQIIWLTTADNVPDGIRPEPENLVAAIRSAIDRFTED